MTNPIMDVKTTFNHCVMCDGTNVTETPSFGKKLEAGTNPVPSTNSPLPSA